MATHTSTITDVNMANEYNLPRGGSEAIRLTSQHFMVTARQGWLLHPTIAEAIKHLPRPRIVDVATGTGIWVTELARQMPHADILGLDISDAQYYPEWTLPPNTSFDIYDLLQEVPPELQGAFDVVHVRLLLIAGPRVDKKVFIDRFRSLLRPGGWLQWDDLGFPINFIHHPREPALHRDLERSDSAFPSLEAVAEAAAHPFAQMSVKYYSAKEKLGWLSRFDEVIEEVGGFDEAESYPVPLRLDLLQMEHDQVWMANTLFLEGLIKRGRIQSDESLEEVRHALTRFQKDAETGVRFSYNWNVCLARKALIDPIVRL